MPLSLEIQTYTEKSCDNLFLEDMTGLYVAGTNEGGYGAPNPTINDITKVNVVVNYTDLNASTEFIFDVASGVITDANFGDYSWDDDGTLVNIQVTVQPDYCILNY